MEEYILRCFEQEVCNISCINTNQNLKINDWYFEIDLSIRNTDIFECMDIPSDENNQINQNKKLFTNKPIAKCYTIVKDSENDNIKLEKSRIEQIIR